MKKQLSFRSLSTALTLGVTFLPTTLTARADLAYTQETRMAEMPQPGGAPFSTTKIFRRVGAERSESTVKMGEYESHQVSLTLCATKQLFTLDPSLKIYYVTPLVKAPAYLTPVVAAKTKKTGPSTGTLTSTLVSFKDLGLQKVGTVAAHGYEVVIRTQSTGCLGEADTTSKQQIFLAPGQSLGDGGSDCGLTASYSSGGGQTTCNPTFIRKGNWAAYDQVMKSLAVRTRVFAKPTDTNWQMEMQTVGIARAKLADSLFQVPTDFKKVSPTEFQQVESQAMMKSMMGNTDSDSDSGTDAEMPAEDNG